MGKGGTGELKREGEDSKRNEVCVCVCEQETGRRENACCENVRRADGAGLTGLFRPHGYSSHNFTFFIRTGMFRTFLTLRCQITGGVCRWITLIRESRGTVIPLTQNPAEQRFFFFSLLS